jgi:hypothetical protein
MGFMQYFIRFAAGFKAASVIRVAFKQIFIDAIQAGPGDLCPRGVIKKNCRAFKRRELLADNFNIKRHG